MWNKIKEWFNPTPTIVDREPQEFVFSPSETTLPKYKDVVTGPFKRGQWVVYGNHVGIVAEFRGADILFHYVDPDTGLTVKEEQLSVLAVRTARISEIPACRMSIPHDVARERGYGD